MNEYGGTPTAVDIPLRCNDTCNHADGYLARWNGLFCGTCKEQGRLPKTWVIRSETRHGVVDPGTGLSYIFGAFSTSIANTRMSMGVFARQWNRESKAKAISEEINEAMRSEFKGVRPIATIFDEIIGSTTA